MSVLDIVAALLEVAPDALETALCTREITTGTGAREEKFQKPATAEGAAFSRDTLAKNLYSKMFDFLVKKVNESIKKPNHDGPLIGVLDIYGFEIFDVRSLCTLQFDVF